MLDSLYDAVRSFPPAHERQRLKVKADHDDTGCSRWWVPKDVAEVLVEGHEDPALGGGEQFDIVSSGERLVPGESGVVAGAAKGSRRPSPAGSRPA